MGSYFEERLRFSSEIASLIYRICESDGFAVDEELSAFKEYALDRARAVTGRRWTSVSFEPFTFYSGATFSRWERPGSGCDCCSNESFDLFIPYRYLFPWCFDHVLFM